MMLAADRITIARRLTDISAQFAPGKITAICGPNGAGKSTLLSTLAGLLTPDSGRVLLDGNDLAAYAPRVRAQRTGYLPQDGELAWDMSVRNLVALGRLPFRDEAKEPGEQAIAKLGLEDFADRPVSTLSGGERARVLLARVLAGEPRWILADEPLAALDIAHQMHLVQHLKNVAASGVGVMLVVHDLALAMNHADQVLVLDDGALAGFGAPEDVLRDDRIEAIWQVKTCWIGEPNYRALITL